MNETRGLAARLREGAEFEESEAIHWPPTVELLREAAAALDAAGERERALREALGKIAASSFTVDEFRARVGGESVYSLIARRAISDRAGASA